MAHLFFFFFLSISFSLLLVCFPNHSRSNSFAYKFPNFHPLFFRSIEWKFQGSNLPTNLPLSLSPLDSMKIPRFEFIQIFKFSNLPRFLFTRSDERTYVQAWPKSPSPFPLPLFSSSIRPNLFSSSYFSLPLAPLGSAPIRRSRLVPGILPPQPGELSQNYGPPVPRKPGPHRDLGEAPSY